MPKHSISIWFFIGSLLTLYGVLILGAGMYELISPVERGVVLARLHIDLWWGGGILVLGLAYLMFNWPRKRV